MEKWLKIETDKGLSWLNVFVLIWVHLSQATRLSLKCMLACLQVAFNQKILVQGNAIEMLNQYEMPIGEPSIEKVVCLWSVLKNNSETFATEISFFLLKIKYWKPLELSCKQREMFY